MIEAIFEKLPTTEEIVAEWMAEAGLHGELSRKMIWEAMAGLDNISKENTMLWVMANGFSDGSDPEAVVTTEQMAAMAFRYAKWKGHDVSVWEETNILSYEDAFDISEYAYPAMQWACGIGLIGGEESELKPQNNVSAEELQQVAVKYMEWKMK